MLSKALPPMFVTKLIVATGPCPILFTAAIEQVYVECGSRLSKVMFVMKVVTLSSSASSSPLQTTMYAKIKPFLPSSSGSFQERVALLVPLFSTVNCCGGFVGTGWDNSNYIAYTLLLCILLASLVVNVLISVIAVPNELTDSTL